MSSLIPSETIFLLCDVQTKFRPAIYGFDQVVFSSNKLIQIAKILNIPVIVTTQNAKGLGPIDPAIDLHSLGDLLLINDDKTLFSMITPSVETVLSRKAGQVKNVVIFGIESHICVLQTALDLLNKAIVPDVKVFVLQDAISSTSYSELSVAVPLLRSAGATVTTTESLAFRLINDAKHEKFKEIAGLVKNSKDGTRKALEVLVLGNGMETEQKSSL